MQEWTKDRLWGKVSFPKACGNGASVSGLVTKQPYREQKKPKFVLKRGEGGSYRKEINVSTTTEMQSKAKNTKEQHITHTFLY